ncbi:MAG: sn-glycerol-1-phosphate dehydrogenase [Pirellulales bacterium]|nr:sn-glycerol-1-phosphate dehydrogenase [Pirellulales bacterium]
MTTSPDALLHNALADARQTKALEVGVGALARAAAAFRGCFGDKPALVVADTNTWRAAGARTVELLRAEGVPLADPLVFEAAGLSAKYVHVERVRAALAGGDAVPVAVGSGTINDLAKLAAHECGRPYLAVATAASMDGYTAFGASIMHRGLKQTFSCPAPRAVVADVDVLRRAPSVLSAAGYGDLAAKSPAGADWIVADALGIEPIHARAWTLVQGELRPWLADPEGVRRGEPAAIEKLTIGLLMSGFGMQAAESSRAASGAEHQFSHLWDMQNHVHNGQTPLHGHKVAIGTLMTTLLYEQLLKQPIETLAIDAVCARWPEVDDRVREAQEAFESADLKRTAAEEIRAKYVDRAALAARLRRLRERWPDLSRRLREQLIPSADLRAKFRLAGAPTESSSLGISPERLRRTFFDAQHIRRRHTVLDLALETGLLGPSVEAIFAAPVSPE